MKPTMTQIKNWYDEFNKQVFNNMLPNVPIKFTNNRRQLGQFYWNPDGTGIKISLYYDFNEEMYRNTLLHEMCHLYCYHRGYIREHHGKHWQNIARYATNITGLEIRRTTNIDGFDVAPENKERQKMVEARKNAPSLLVDLDYGDHHFIIKTTKKVLLNNDSSDSYFNLRTRAKHYRIFVSDDPLFLKYQTSRSIHRGYKYSLGDYVRTIEPKFEKSIEVLSVWELFQGKYDCLGIR